MCAVGTWALVILSFARTLTVAWKRGLPRHLTNKHTQAPQGGRKACQDLAGITRQSRGPGQHLPLPSARSVVLTGPPVPASSGPGAGLPCPRGASFPRGLLWFPDPHQSVRRVQRWQSARLKQHPACSSEPSSQVRLERGGGRRAHSASGRLSQCPTQDNRAGPCAARGSLLRRLHQ